MTSTTKRGNYYKRKSREYYEKHGYQVQLTEFACGMVIKGKTIYRKIDIFASDGIAMNGEEIIFWNAKATTEDVKDGVSKRISEAKKEFEKYKFPPSVIREAIVWLPRKQPIVRRFSTC